jgi:tripartite-type tricarboxylate transporter receptor subunit TctC
MTKTLRYLVAGTAIGLAFAAGAQAPNFPTGPVKIVVAYPPGGANDFLARAIGAKLADDWKQPVVVENKPGASGIIGSDLVAKSAPDGQTLLLGSVTNVILPSLYDKLPFDALKDFTPVAMLAYGPLLVVVHPSVPVNSVAELIAYAKKNPGKLSYGTAGSGTSVHIAVEMFKKQAGVDIVHIPYKGSGPAMLDLVGGQTQLMMDVIPSALPQVKAGKIRALAVTGSKRVPELPDLPTVAESGLPGFDVAAWWGVLGPAGIPRQVVEKINADINRVLAMPDIRQSLAGRGLEATPMSTAEFDRVMRSDEARFGAVVKEGHIKPD